MRIYRSCFGLCGIIRFIPILSLIRKRWGTLTYPDYAREWSGDNFGLFLSLGIPSHLTIWCLFGGSPRNGSDFDYPNGVRDTLEQIDVTKRLIELYPDDVFVFLRLLRAEIS